MHLKVVLKVLVDNEHAHADELDGLSNEEQVERFEEVELWPDMAQGLREEGQNEEEHGYDELPDDAIARYLVNDALWPHNLFHPFRS